MNVAVAKRLVTKQAPGEWQPLVRYQPMLARSADRPPEGPYAFEIKWDGVRALTYLKGSKVRLYSRNALDITYQYPELQPLAKAAKLKSAVLDGEIVALDELGSPHFTLLQTRMHVASPELAMRRAKAVPAVYMIFDLLELNGKPTLNLPYAERRKVLLSLQLNNDSWRTPPTLDATFDEAFEAIQRINLEGLVAKRLDSVYSPGQRSQAWLKIKAHKRQELIICGWQEGQGNRTGLPGAILLGYYVPSNVSSETSRLAYAGQCGTGFSVAALQALKASLEEREIKNNPFLVRAPRGRELHFSKPELVGEFKFTEWTPDGALRHPVFLGLREDKIAEDVVRE